MSIFRRGCYIHDYHGYYCNNSVPFPLFGLAIIADSPCDAYSSTLTNDFLFVCIQILWWNSRWLVLDSGGGGDSVAKIRYCNKQVFSNPSESMNKFLLKEPSALLISSAKKCKKGAPLSVCYNLISVTVACTYYGIRFFHHST